jgi:hypothetical protein
MMVRIQKCFVALGAAALVGVGCAGFGTANAGSSDTASIESAAQALVAREDFRGASKAYFALATARSQLNQTAEACAALSQSLDYYRKAVGEEAQPSFQQASFDKSNEGDAMTEVLSRFGCVPGSTFPAGYAITRR